MRIDLLLYALPLFLGNTLAAPFPDSAAAALVAPSPAADTLTLVPFDRRSLTKRSGRGGKFNLSGGGRKKKDGSDAGPSKPNNNNGGGGGPSKPKPDPVQKAKVVESTQKKASWAQVAAKDKKAEREDAASNLSAESKKQTDDAIAAQKPPQDRPDAERKNKNTDDEDEAEQKKKDEEHGVTAPPLVITEIDLATAWRKFENAPGGKGTDGKGWVKPDDIANGFKKCKVMGPNKYLFWSAGIGNKVWERAVIPEYARFTGRLVISEASKKCSRIRSTGLASMGGRGDELAKLAAEAARDRMMASGGTPKSKKTGKAVEPRKPTLAQLKEANNNMMYKYYWAEMSRGFAMAAEGSIEWFHPEGITIRANMHWNAVELPEVSKNFGTRVTTVKEVTYPLDKTKAPYDFREAGGLKVIPILPAST